MRKLNIFIMTLAGLLLVVASILKFQEMLSICVPSWDANAAHLMQTAEKAGETMPAWKANMMGFWESYEFLLIQIPLEFALGVWLVSGLFRKAAWIAGTLMYAFFIAVTLVKAILGLESCGCFGQVHVNPWITLWAVDVPFFLILAIFRPKGYKLLPPPWPNTFYLLAVFVFTIGLMVLAPSTMVSFRPDCIKAEEVQPDASAQLKLQIHQLKQKLQKQIDLIDLLSQQVKDRQQTIDEQQTQIQSLQEQVRLKSIAPLTLKRLHETDPNNVFIRIKGSDQLIPLLQPAEPVPPVKTQPEPNQSDESASQADRTQLTETPEQSADAHDQTLAVEQWDWLQYVVEDDVREQLTQGLVVILMYHHDCPDCAVMVPKYSTYYAGMFEQGDDAFKMAFLAIPPYDEEGPVPEDTQCILGKLSDQEKWEVTSPYVVALLDGEVMKTWEQGTAPEPDKILEELDGVFGQ